jgi:predicted nucleic acid-binding protein
MIVLDTNVVSEMMKSAPSSTVTAWIKAQPQPGIHVTAITRAEIFYGIELLPAGKRRNAIADAAEILFAQRIETPIFAHCGVRIVNPWSARVAR